MVKIKWRLKGNRLAKHILAEQIASNRLANYYLIIGPDGIGKDILIEDFIKIIRCQNEEHKPCLKCPGCRMVEKGSDPELLIVKPEKGKGLLIKQTRAIRRRMKLKSFSHRPIVWLKHAERLTIDAANNILKLLEDSSGHNRTIFILTAKDCHLPPTVISRAQIIFLHPVKLDEKAGSAIDQLIASSGLEGLFNQVQQQPQKKKRIKELLEYYRRLKKSSIADRLEAVNKKLIAWPINTLFFYFILYERRAFLVNLNRNLGVEDHYHNLKHLLESYNFSQYQVNRKILLKNLFLKLR